MKKLIMFAMLTAMLAGTTSCSNDLKDDRDGQTYKTIKINNQTWMAENLRYGGTKYFSANNNESNDAIYGYLYLWENAKRACPKGWRLPTKEEFEDLITATRSEYTASSIRANKWVGSNTSGFSALPAGFSDYHHNINDFGSNAYFWSATPDDSDHAYSLEVYPDNPMDSDGAHVHRYNVNYALSVRCIKDSN